MEERCSMRNKLASLSQITETASPTVDDYEPVHNLNTKLKKGARIDKVQVPRPRYYSTELGIREKIFIGILSSPQTILTVGSALNRTVSKYASKVLFFLEGAEAETIDVNIGSVVGFPDKQEILAPFNMLQYIADNFLNEYDFYFFTKDTSHIRGHTLMDMVNHISITQNVHMGQPLDSDSLYCSLDAGVLLSHSVFSQTVKDLEWCVQHTFSESSSNNFGRCVLHGTEQPCVSSVQVCSYIVDPE